MFSTKKKKKRSAVSIAAQTRRYVVAFAIPRHRFVKQEMIGTPWWKDGRFRTEAEALSRFNKLVSCVSPLDGEVAIYSVIITHGEDSTRELLVHYSGKTQAPLLKRVLPITLDVKTALLEIERSWEKREAARLADAPPTLPRKPRRVISQKKSSHNHWIFPVGATFTVTAGLIWLAFEAAGTTITSPIAKPVVHAPIPASISKPEQFSIVTKRGDGSCERIYIENSSGKVLNWSQERCGQ